MKLKSARFLATLGLVVGLADVAHADVVPYPASGVPNTQAYAFQAVGTSDITAYFAGSTAQYDEVVGMLDNGVLTSAGFGLDDHTSSIGQSFDFGHVNAGDTLVFVLDVLVPPLGDVYSDPSLNSVFDANGTDGHNHIYATAYTATSPLLPGVPAGMYVAFEDLPFPYSDFNYHDETYVVTGLAVTVVPEPASFAVLAAGLIGFGMVRVRRGRA